MRIRLRLLGVTVVTLTFDPGSKPEYEEESDRQSRGIGGGSGHNFERSYEEPEDGCVAFGFH